MEKYGGARKNANNMAPAHGILDNKPTRAQAHVRACAPTHTLTNTHGRTHAHAVTHARTLSTAIVASRTRFSVTLHVHFLSCYN